MDVNFAKITSKDVIDVSVGKKIGRIGDVIFDDEENKIKSFVIFGESKMFGLKKTEDLVFGIEKILQIGEDVILVDIKNEEKPEKDNVQKSNFIYSPKVFRRGNR